MGGAKKTEKRVIKANRIVNLQKALDKRRLIKLGLNFEEEDFKTPNGDPWESCQVDINKLVQPNKVSSELDQQMGSQRTQAYDERILGDVKVEQDATSAGASTVLEIHPVEMSQFQSWGARPALLQKALKASTSPPVVEESECLGCLGLLQQSQRLRQSHADMLRECFSLEVECATLCMACFTRLSDAQCFKRDVLSNSQRFEVRLKEEVMSETGDDFTEMVDTTDMDYELEKSEEKCIVQPLHVAALDVEVTASSAAHDRTLQPSLYEQDVKEGKRKKSRKEIGTKKARQKQTGKLPPADKHTKDEANTGDKETGLYRLTRSDYTKAEDGSVRCVHCDKHFRKVAGMRMHILHHRDRPRYPCPLCSEGFRTLASFVSHKFTKHNVDDRIKCTACDSVFNTRTQLGKHKNSYHMLGRKLQCPNSQCDYECFSKEALYKHKFKHRTVKDFHCKYCRKSFLRKATLALHERIHTGDRRKVCGECGQAFVQKASLNYHMTKYHPAVKF